MYISLKDRILNHLENVRDWLDRAEMEYKNDRILQGELNLNLARAELKKAFEESRRLYCEKQVVYIPSNYRDSKKGEKRFSWLVKHQIGLVAAIVLFLLVGLTPFFNQKLDTGQPVVFEDIPQKVVETLKEEPQVFDELSAGPVEVQSVSKKQTEKPAQINRRVYNQMPLHFNIKKMTFYTPEEVNVKTIKFKSSDLELKDQLTLISRELKPLGRRNIYLTGYSSQSLATDRTYITKVNKVNYDLDMLVDLATKVLYATY
ncbi:hypothetical protein BBF96_11590 [Anoxybacter fermentans]|uniref:Uncharacterized protein n=1 Tax=Anoxybacter fermentans TaxID=1323375 RepID=A0A3Q9HRS9_9FIRM|nr:hypothetical protein [Anoxybacter fermentans]AZR73975.1 hypothetical protein BBF96_11590 [Anoxybacter fermentans]